jgi:hypothetical protein
MTALSLFAGLGALFGALGSAAAYLIFYREYRRHFVDAGKARAMALRGAAAAFLFFAGLSLLAGYAFTRFVIPGAAGGP